MNKLRRQRLEEIAKGSGYSGAEISALCTDAIETIRAQEIVICSVTVMTRLINRFASDQASLSTRMAITLEQIFNDSELHRAAAVLDLKLKKDV